MLTDWLRSTGVAAAETREPSDGRFGLLLREMLRTHYHTDPLALAAGFVADRYDHLFNVDTGVARTLDQGTTVVCDRYVWSTLAYQGAAGVEMRYLVEANRFALVPDVTFFLDVPPEMCHERVTTRSLFVDLFEDVENLQATLLAYSELRAAGFSPGRLFVIDGTPDAETVHESVRHELEALLSSEGANAVEEQPIVRPAGGGALKSRTEAAVSTA
jgi:dTMP kinase